MGWRGSVLIDIADCQTARILVVTRIVHLQGLKDPLLYEGLIGLTGYLFDDVTENPVAAIAVTVPLARLEIQGGVFEAVQKLTGSDRRIGIVCYQRA